MADSTAFSTFDALQSYLENRIGVLETARPESSSVQTATSFKGMRTARVATNAATISKQKNVCPIYQESHALSYCRKFKVLPASQRLDQVKKAGVYYNCLRAGHFVDSCTSAGHCMVCGEKHHTLLHGLFPEARSLTTPEEASTSDASVLNSRISAMTGEVSSNLTSHCASGPGERD